MDQFHIFGFAYIYPKIDFVISFCFKFQEPLNTTKIIVYDCKTFLYLMHELQGYSLIIIVS